MLKRTTIEIDQELLERAKRVLGHATTRGTVEEALRRAAESAKDEQASRSVHQRRYFDHLGERADLEVLRSDEMWR
ncbi:MAG: type II toxin-antitoxin system VapB family antitoxin [Actinomycetota bacterium]